MSSAPRECRHTGTEESAAPRFYVHPSQREAIPTKDRLRLLGFLSVLLEFSAVHDGRRFVTESRTVLAEASGVHVDTVKRAERDLQRCGLIRQIAQGRASRQLEILPPPTSPLRPIRASIGTREGCTGAPLNSTESANRAVDNSLPEMTAGVHPCTPQGGTGAPLKLVSPYSEFRERESRRAGAGARGGGARAPEPQADFADRAAGNLARWVSDELERAGTGDAFRLRPMQRAGVAESIRKRLEALDRSGAGSAAEPTARKDLERVLGYALARPKPAAYLAGALRGRDWHSHTAQGSEAARVAAAGPAAERPEYDRPPSAGVLDVLAAGDLERALARLERAIEQAPLSAAERAQLRAYAPTTARDALAAAVDLERAAIKAARSATPDPSA